MCEFPLSGCPTLDHFCIWKLRYCTVVLSAIRFTRFNLVCIWYLVIPFFFILLQGIINETVYQICIGSHILLAWVVVSMVLVFGKYLLL